MNRSSGHPERRMPARWTCPSLSAARRAVLHDAVLLRGVRLRRRGRDRAPASSEGSPRPRRGRRRSEAAGRRRQVAAPAAGCRRHHPGPGHRLAPARRLRLEQRPVQGLRGQGQRRRRAVERDRPPARRRPEQRRPDPDGADQRGELARDEAARRPAERRAAEGAEQAARRAGLARGRDAVPHAGARPPQGVPGHGARAQEGDRAGRRGRLPGLPAAPGERRHLLGLVPGADAPGAERSRASRTPRWPTRSSP